MTDVRRLTQTSCDDYPHLSVCSSCLLLFLIALLLDSSWKRYRAPKSSGPGVSHLDRKKLGQLGWIHNSPILLRQADSRLRFTFLVTHDTRRPIRRVSNRRVSDLKQT